ncbi:MAG: hypothetical protein ABF680_04140 [Acetobacter persici]
MVFSRKQRLEDLLQQSRGGDAGLVFFAGNQAKKNASGEGGVLCGLSLKKLRQR